jgi:hypothetical protein
MAIKRSSYKTLPTILICLLIVISIALAIYGIMTHNKTFVASLIIAFTALICTNINQLLNERHTISSIHIEAIYFLKKQLQILDLLEELDMNCETLDESTIQKINIIYEKRYDLIPDDRKIVENIKKLSLCEKVEIQKINKNIEELLIKRDGIEQEYDTLIKDIQKEINLP